MLTVQESAHDWQVPGNSLSHRRGGGTSMSSLSGTEREKYYVQPVCSPSKSQLMTGKYQVSFCRTEGGGGRTTMSSLGHTGVRASMSSPCARHPGVSS